MQSYGIHCVKHCYDEMKNLSGTIKKNNREHIQIDKDHVYMIAKYGPVVKYEKDGETKFKSAKKDLDIEKLKRGRIYIGRNHRTQTIFYRQTTWFI